MKQRKGSPPGPVYLENGTRWMEKQEAKSLRMALEDMDLAEEKKVHQDAQDEAAELVWKHQNPAAAKEKEDAPFQNPDLEVGKRDYKSHLRKGSYHRSHSQEGVPMISSFRRTSGSSNRASIDVATFSQRPSLDTTRKVSPPTAVKPSMPKARTASGKGYGDLAAAVKKDIETARRRTSSGSKRVLSGEKKMFMHPDDRIWEDPQEEPTPPKIQRAASQERPPISATPSYVRKNPFARVRMQQSTFERSNSAPVLNTTPILKHDRTEIQRNPPSQSRNPWYKSNEPLPPTPPNNVSYPAAEETPPKGTPKRGATPQGTPTKDGKEIRSDDIRAATSKQRKDRSPQLPQPTLVSDKPGRPIVSFQKDAWKPKEVVLEEVHSGPDTPEPLKITKNADSPQPKSSFNPLPLKIEPPKPVPSGGQNSAVPPIPTICTPDHEPEVPTIVLPEEPDFADVTSGPPTPAISFEPPIFTIYGPGFSTKPSAHPISQRPHLMHAATTLAQRPLPTIHAAPTAPQRPLPTPSQNMRHAVTAPLPKSTPHYTPSIRQSGALCAHCALPIAGRILSAAGQRFHPGCFVCHQCHTNLECVAFYPEPDSKREERLARIQARQNDSDVPGNVVQQEMEDGDQTFRFYCHLDYHELFSPRCKSCQTPIEGEVIVACGAEWHQGHFFCAQCGDPFDSTTPFVEKDGYAWCVGCHTNRYSSKCRGCRKPVTDVVVKALGCDWHSKCFACLECGGEFEDGRYFLRGEGRDPVCVRCEERRLKA